MIDITRDDSVTYTNHHSGCSVDIVKFKAKETCTLVYQSERPENSIVKIDGVKVYEAISCLGGCVTVPKDSGCEIIGKIHKWTVI